MSNFAINPVAVVPGLSNLTNLAKGVAAVAVIAGQLVAKDNSNKIILASASASLPGNRVAGIAACTSAPGQPVFYVTRDPELTIGGDLAPGDALILSTTPGAACPASEIAPGMFITNLGVSLGNGKFNFNPTAAGVARPA